MIIDCIADLHGFYPELEGGDLLIVAGDLTSRDEHGQYLRFFHWIANLNYKKKILIAGNHDGLQEKEKLLEIPADFEYLQDSGTEYGNRTFKSYTRHLLGKYDRQPSNF